MSTSVLGGLKDLTSFARARWEDLSRVAQDRILDQMGEKVGLDAAAFRLRWSQYGSGARLTLEGVKQLFTTYQGEDSGDQESCEVDEEENLFEGFS